MQPCVLDWLPDASPSSIETAVCGPREGQSKRSARCPAERIVRWSIAPSSHGRRPRANDGGSTIFDFSSGKALRVFSLCPDRDSVRAAIEEGSGLMGSQCRRRTRARARVAGRTARGVPGAWLNTDQPARPTAHGDFCESSIVQTAARPRTSSSHHPHDSLYLATSIACLLLVLGARLDCLTAATARADLDSHRGSPPARPPAPVGLLADRAAWSTSAMRTACARMQTRRHTGKAAHMSRLLTLPPGPCSVATSCQSLRVRGGPAAAECSMMRRADNAWSAGNRTSFQQPHFVGCVRCLPPSEVHADLQAVQRGRWLPPAECAPDGVPLVSSALHSKADQQDMRTLGGFIDFLPFTYAIISIAHQV